MSNRKIEEAFVQYCSMVDSGQIVYDEQQVKLLKTLTPYLSVKKLCHFLPIKKEIKKDWYIYIWKSW
ncbi:MAG: hypothetical protein ACTJLM_00985 [Ehrlichia sp.]